MNRLPRKRWPSADFQPVAMNPANNFLKIVNLYLQFYDWAGNRSSSKLRITSAMRRPS
jgi:hypothetical protein